jgi:hypothetical protein
MWGSASKVHVLSGDDPDRDAGAPRVGGGPSPAHAVPPSDKTTTAPPDESLIVVTRPLASPPAGKEPPPLSKRPLSPPIVRLDAAGVPIQARPSSPEAGERTGVDGDPNR